jgi:anti-sigma factor RsiW
MTCDEVRELLPEHLLGSLAETQDAAIRRHLRGCAECRDERVRLEDGVAALSYAADQAPPDELRERVLDVLTEEWDAPEEEEHPPAATSGERRATASAWRWLSVAAAVVLIAVSLGWGVAQAQRADRVAADASSYQSLLATLGGREFRIGTIQSADGAAGMGGTVVLYDGAPGGSWNSWGLVLAHAPTYDGPARAMLLGSDGKTLELPPLTFKNGEASTWLVTHEDLTGYDRLVITGSDGSVLANARIVDA